MRTLTHSVDQDKTGSAVASASLRWLPTLIAVSLALVLCPTIYSQPPADFVEQTLLAQDIERLESELDSIVNATSTSGAAVAIVSRDSIIWTGSFGLANIETGEPVTERTLFCIGSCTKSFTGLGILKLVDEGVIDVNTPVREIAPEITIDNSWEDTDPVRVVHLLEHTTGFDDSHPNWFYFDGPVLTLREALDKKAHLRKARWLPGTRFSYSSVGFNVAGYVIEKTYGQPFEECLKNEILTPIGMANTVVGYSQSSESPKAVGYDRNIEPILQWYDYDIPAGAIFSSVEEMAVFVQFLLNRGSVGDRQVISDSLFDRIGRPTTTLGARNGLPSGYSFGIGTRYRAGVKWLGHSGAVPGFVSEYYYSPDAGLGFVVLQNSFGIMFDSDVFDRVWEFVSSRVDSLPEPLSEPLQCEQLRSYCGYYEPRNPRLQLTGFIELLTSGVDIFCENDTLYTQGMGEDRSPLVPVTGNLFRRSRDPEATRAFIETADGEMVYASQGSYYEKTTIWKTYLRRFLVISALVLMLSSIAYAIFWVPVYVFKRLTRKENLCRYPSMRLIPLLAVLALVAGIAKMADQTLLEFGSKTTLNAIFYVSTLIFAALSTLSLYTTYRSFSKQVKTVARVYAILLSLSCFGMTLYLGYWGIIGLRLWAY
ncbi:MAG: beta-lactamase family protein [Candidatus Zixiibacteriota bacterium]|nr:MAG: beta-lactamase family protein [candidate division Zixibacteria bacterium]